MDAHYAILWIFSVEVQLGERIKVDTCCSLAFKALALVLMISFSLVIFRFIHAAVIKKYRAEFLYEIIAWLFLFNDRKAAFYI